MNVLVALVASTILLACGGSSGPCSGGGMEKDPRSLPADWASVGSPPDGAIACHEKPYEGQSSDSPYTRHYEIGKSPQEGIDAWRAHLAATGWNETKFQLRDGNTHRLEADKDGCAIRIGVSMSVKDKGWATVTFTPDSAI